MAKKKCLGCGDIFETKNFQRYCKKCRNIEMKCAKCGKYFKLTPKQLTKYRKYGTSEWYYCSKKCSANAEETQQRYRKTYKKNTGYDHPMLDPNWKKRCRKHYKEKTGYEYWTNNPKTLEKRKQTWIENFGEDNPMKNKRIRDKAAQTWMNSLGVEHPWKSDEVRKKAERTMEREYGEKHPMHVPELVEKRKQTWLKTIGYINPGQSPECQNKAQRTNIERYGETSYCKTDEFLQRRKETWRNKYGEENPMKVPNIQNKAAQKALKTRIKNNNIPKTERIFKEKLLELGYIENIDFFLEYKSNDYPFRCDFYLKWLNLYVELNCHPAHGAHWFNKNSKEDLKIKQYLEDKKDISSFYNSVLKTWTIDDVKKRNYAKKNNLKYVVLWAETEIEDWFNQGMPVRKDWQ